MKYADGIEVRLGDRVRLFDMQTAVVVFSVDVEEYSDEFSKDEWAYLKKGVMVRTDDGALIHLDDSHVNEITRIP